MVGQQRSWCAEEARTQGWTRRRAVAGRGARSEQARICIEMLLVLLFSGLAGCYEHQPCGLEESCNFEDDDCDGRIDEDFVDSLGRYDQLEHCGACGVDCRTVHPHATELSCEELGPSYGCVALSCEEGFRLEGRGCLAVVDVSCLACERDADCSRFTTGARCVELGGSQRCVAPCDPAAGCPPGFGCQEGWCEPETGQCACTTASEGVSFACLLSSGSAVCAGRQLCEQGEVGPCLPLFAEQCNGEDDDCDGETDEDFLDEQGRYVTWSTAAAATSPAPPPGPTCSHGARSSRENPAACSTVRTSSSTSTASGPTAASARRL